VATDSFRRHAWHASSLLVSSGAVLTSEQSISQHNISVTGSRRPLPPPAVAVRPGTAAPQRGPGPAAHSSQSRTAAAHSPAGSSKQAQQQHGFSAERPEDTAWSCMLHGVHLRTQLEPECTLNSLHLNVVSNHTHTMRPLLLLLLQRQHLTLLLIPYYHNHRHHHEQQQQQACFTLSSSVLKAFMLAAGVGPPFLRASHLVNTMPNGTCGTHTTAGAASVIYAGHSYHRVQPRCTLQHVTRWTQLPQGSASVCTATCYTLDTATFQSLALQCNCSRCSHGDSHCCPTT
jgi:hypothetical protein